VRLGTDDPAQPKYILRFDMTVRPEVTVDAERGSLGDVAPHESPEIRFHFTREGGEPLKVDLVSAVPPHLDADLVRAGTTAELRITFHPARLQPGVTAGLEVLQVATNAPKQPQFTLYVDWRLALAVVPVPSRLVFSDPQTTLLELTLTARDGQPFRILEASIQGQGFELLDPPTKAAHQHVLRIRRGGREPQAMLVLTFSNQDSPLKVPLRFLDPTARPATVTAPSSGVPQHPGHPH
jgi:uncharacterized protein YcgL (UPF0745 family)